MAALDRLDELEGFMLELQPEETFRPHSLWRLPLLGSHDYRLPDTIAARLGDITKIARELAPRRSRSSSFATDVTEIEHGHGDARVRAPLLVADDAAGDLRGGGARLGCGQRARAAAPVGDRIATDGAWVRNFPLGHAYDQPGVELIVSFRYQPSYPRFDAAWLGTLRRRLERFPKLPPLRALTRELQEARSAKPRGEPAHWGDMIARLMRVAIQQNAVLEERTARPRPTTRSGARGAA